MALQTYKMENISGAQFENGVNLMQSSIATKFDVEDTYKPGDYVIKDGLLYMCIDGDFVPGPWDATQWEQYKIFDNEEAIINCGSKTKNI